MDFPRDKTSTVIVSEMRYEARLAASTALLPVDGLLECVVMAVGGLASAPYLLLIEAGLRLGLEVFGGKVLGPLFLIALSSCYVIKVLKRCLKV